MRDGDTPHDKNAIERLRDTYKRLSDFSTTLGDSEGALEANLVRVLAQDTSDPLIIDRSGLSARASGAIADSVSQIWQQYQDLRLTFQHNFRAFLDIQNKIQECELKKTRLREEAEEKLSQIDDEAERNPTYAEYKRAKRVYEDQRARHRTAPTLWAASSRFVVNPVYAVIMLLVGVAEYFINYDTLFLFFGVPVIAIGATTILAICLALIAHEHGKIVKQWRKRYSREVSRKDREYLILFLTIFGLLLLIAVTGWMRLQAVDNLVTAPLQNNILGKSVAVNVDPTREVVISLGANVLAWFVGVLISYAAHDADPIYMANAIDYQRMRRKAARIEKEVARDRDETHAKMKADLDETDNLIQSLKETAYLNEAIQMNNEISNFDQRVKEHITAFSLKKCFFVKNWVMQQFDVRQVILHAGDSFKEIDRATFQAQKFDVPTFTSSL